MITTFSLPDFKQQVHCMALDELNFRNILTIMPPEDFIVQWWKMYTKEEMKIEEVVGFIVVESTFINNMLFTETTLLN